MSDLETDIADLAPSAIIVTLIDDVAAARSVFTDRRADYVSFRPSVEEPIAFYAYRDRVVIQVEPIKAHAVTSALPGSTMRTRTGSATASITVGQSTLGTHHGEVLAHCVDALEWRTHGQRRGLQDGRHVVLAHEPDICPTCHMEISKAGSCSCTD